MASDDDLAKEEARLARAMDRHEAAKWKEAQQARARQPHDVRFSRLIVTHARQRQASEEARLASEEARLAREEEKRLAREEEKRLAREEEKRLEREELERLEEHLARVEAPRHSLGVTRAAASPSANDSRLGEQRRKDDQEHRQREEERKKFAALAARGWNAEEEEYLIPIPVAPPPRRTRSAGLHITGEAEIPIAVVVAPVSGVRPSFLLPFASSIKDALWFFSKDRVVLAGLAPPTFRDNLPLPTAGSHVEVFVGTSVFTVLRIFSGGLSWIPAGREEEAKVSKPRLSMEEMVSVFSYVHGHTVPFFRVLDELLQPGAPIKFKGILADWDKKVLPAMLGCPNFPTAADLNTWLDEDLLLLEGVQFIKALFNVKPEALPKSGADLLAHGKAVSAQGPGRTCLLL